MEHSTLIFGLALILGLYMAWNIGANDVANAMGTSVGSGALTLKRALLVAAVLEFCGAFFMGSHVSSTIESGIVNPHFFANSPQKLVYGMLASLVAAGAWLQIASYYGWPVSTTHSIVGALVGFGLVYGGIEAILWGNVGIILGSWILSPILGAALSYFLFSFLRQQIFYHQDPLRRTKQLVPWITFGVFTLLSVVILYKGISNVQMNLSVLQLLLFCIGVGLLGAAGAIWLVKTLPHKQHLGAHGQLTAIERIFTYLQIVTACCMAFAHGANDVANGIGPVAAIVSLVQTGTILQHDAVPSWILALGGVGIIVGLATWGWRVIETIGKKITELTPSRGFCAEFGAAITILFASKIGLPISTTHTLVGSVLGVGLAGGIGALNLHMIRDIVLSWVVTVPAGALFAIVSYWVFAELL